MWKGRMYTVHGRRLMETNKAHEYAAEVGTVRERGGENVQSGCKLGKYIWVLSTRLMERGGLSEHQSRHATQY